MPVSPFTNDLIICGGLRDPNIRVLCDSASRLGIGYRTVRFDSHSEPAFTWDFAEDTAFLDGDPLSARGAFIRYDVFSCGSPGEGERLDKAAGWYSALSGWCLARPSVKVLNRHLDARAHHKACVLKLAADMGLRIPATVVSNERCVVDNYLNAAEVIAKPVAGGSFCRRLDVTLPRIHWAENLAPIPAFLQELLTYPEFRVYLVGNDIFLFKMNSPSLDYREKQDATIVQAEPEEIGAEVMAKLLLLARELGIDFAAVDLKTDSRARAALFLEMNTGPMFAAFDAVAGGMLSKAILRFLLS